MNTTKESVAWDAPEDSESKKSCEAAVAENTIRLHGVFDHV